MRRRRPSVGASLGEDMSTMWTFRRPCVRRGGGGGFSCDSGCSGCGDLVSLGGGRSRSAAKTIAGGGYFGCAVFFVWHIVMGHIGGILSSPGNGEEGKGDGEPHVSLCPLLGSSVGVWKVVA